jgi:hypothetical protein
MMFTARSIMLAVRPESDPLRIQLPNIRAETLPL